jgi:hypothetical protein
MKKLLLAALITASCTAQAIECIDTEKFVTATMEARLNGVDKHKMIEHAVLMRDQERGLELLRAISLVFNSPIDSDAKELGHKAWIDCIKETFGE